LCLVSADTQAFPSCLTTFQGTYPASQTDEGGGCQVCHETSNGSNFNPYGTALRDSATQFNCAAALLAVEGLDSDTDNGGFSNLEEINAGTQPGWCVFVPGGTCLETTATAPNTTLDPDTTNQIPMADAGGPYEGEAGTTLIQFDGTGSTDADNDPLTYSWDFGDGTLADGVMPTHTYVLGGTYEVTLVVNDGQASSDPSVTTATITEPVVNLAPVADPGGPYSGEPGQPVAFDGSGSADPNGDTLSYSWDFGDGAIGDGVAPSHAYAAAGNYTATLVVSDGQLDSDVATTTVEIAEPGDVSDGEVLYNTNCAACHADPWGGPAVDESLSGLRRVAGARSCNISGSIFGTSVFPNGVPEMQFLQGLTEAEMVAMAEYLNSRDTSGERRYVTTCAGCHGNDGSGGRTHEDVHGESVAETWEAIEEEDEMRYLACMPESDIKSIADFLKGFDDDFDDDGINDDDDPDDDNDGIHDDDDPDDDNDGVDDDDEYDDGTDPRDDDCDDDGMSDGEEREHGTDPRDHDSDDDELDDGEENDLGTDPKDWDSDNDGKSDGEEVRMGTDPLVAEATGEQGSSGSGGGSTGAFLLMLLALAGVRRRLTGDSN
jgi:mono/diheme cytochrome c family protein